MSVRKLIVSFWVVDYVKTVNYNFFDSTNYHKGLTNWTDQWAPMYENNAKRQFPVFSEQRKLIQ